MTLKILIADDHPLVREGIQNVLRHIEEDILSFEAVNFDEVKTLINQYTDFDLVLLDLCMPEMKGMSSLLELRQLLPGTPIVVVSASDDSDDIRGAINSGANGYIHKSSSNEVMLNALRLVLSGGLYLPPQWARMPDNKEKTGDTILTQRQKEVVNLLATGKANKEIAREFSISDKTVKAHLSEIFKRLDVGNRTQAVHRAKKLGLLHNTG